MIDCRGTAIHMKIIAITNQKGGTAKTTSTAALGVLLSRRGIPVHLIDMDPQADLTAAFGIDGSNSRLFDCLRDQSRLEVIKVAESLTISPSNLQLLRAESELLTSTSREFVLRTALRNTELSDEGVVLIDCPPSLGVLSVAALSAAQGICVVVQPGGFELQTLVHLGQTVDLLRQYVNPELQTIGAIVTNSHRRRSITSQVVDELASQYSVLGTIRSDARIVYATTAGSIHRLRSSSAMEDYDAVADRIAEWLAV
ncbi:chromosome partitioning protein [Rhodopirellula bahusiensis]|uniref:Chromosome partitioning protein n=2 Tax=Rhodopirellula bahusiensis TaxID=2014065 RepID=A0A2G1W7Y2_9BACT|nr:chromosome partitioning protein [Rhodopirellula bahusiensis]